MESAAEAWLRRYGSPPPELDHRLAGFLGHRSIRRFTDQDVPESLVEGLIAAAQSAATSSHLQLWSVISVDDPERRRAIEAVAGYAHVATAPRFFVFLADIYRLARNTTGGDALDFAEYYTMAVVDAALAAERMVCAAESLDLGICYIGAVRNDPARMAEVLDLPEGTFAVFGLCLGYPAERPAIKPRLTSSDVWFRETYRREVTTAEFDERMKGYYAERNQDPAVTWSMRSGRRSNTDHLTGRQVLLHWLQSRGWLRR